MIGGMASLSLLCSWYLGMSLPANIIKGDRITGAAIFHPRFCMEYIHIPRWWNTCLVNSRIIPEFHQFPVKQDGNSLEEASLSASWFFLINGSHRSGKGVEPKGRWQCFCLENEKQQRLNQKGSQRDLRWRGRKTDTKNHFDLEKWLQFRMFFFETFTLLVTIPQKGTSEDDIPFPQVGYVSSLKGMTGWCFVKDDFCWVNQDVHQLATRNQVV